MNLGVDPEKRIYGITESEKRLPYNEVFHCVRIIGESYTDILCLYIERPDGFDVHSCRYAVFKRQILINHDIGKINKNY